MTRLGVSHGYNFFYIIKPELTSSLWIIDYSPPMVPVNVCRWLWSLAHDTCEVDITATFQVQFRITENFCLRNCIKKPHKTAHIILLFSFNKYTDHFTTFQSWTTISSIYIHKCCFAQKQINKNQFIILSLVFVDFKIHTYISALPYHTPHHKSNDALALGIIKNLIAFPSLYFSNTHIYYLFKPNINNCGNPAGKAKGKTNMSLYLIAAI